MNAGAARWKSAVAVVAGVVAMGLVVMVAEELGRAIFHPPPPPQDPAAFAAYLDALPLGSKVSVVVAWVLGGFAGGVVTALVADQDWRRPAAIVGVIDVISVILMLVAIQHPLWMAILGLGLPIPAALLGGRIGSRYAHLDPSSRMPPG